MKKILLTGASILALTLTQAMAQESRDIQELNGADRPQAEGAGPDGANRQAQSVQNGERPPFPPPDVSDDDLETWSEAEQDRAAEDDRRPSRQADQGGVSPEDFYSEGEMIPEDFLSFQGPDAWEGQGEDDVDGEDDFQDFQRRRALRTEDRRLSEEQGPASAWDGRYAGDSNGSFHAGDLHPDREARRDRRAADDDRRRTDDGPDQRTTAATGQRDERTRNAARHAFGLARSAMPEVEFRTYQEGFDRERRVFEFAGMHKETGRRIEVDVLGNGRIEEIEEQIPLSAVPPRIREIVTDALNGMRVDRAERSIRRNLSIYYEFDGSSANGRPLSVEIRSDGDNFRIEERSRS